MKGFLALVLVLSIAGHAAAQQTLPDGGLPRQQYLTQCAKSIDYTNNVDNFLRLAPDGANRASDYNSKYKDGCNVNNERFTDQNRAAIVAAGKKVDEDAYNALNTGTGNQGLFQDQKDCLAQFPQLSAALGRAEVYTGRNLKSIGDGGVSRINVSPIDAYFVLPIPHRDSATPAVWTRGRNIFLSAAQTDLVTRNLPEVPTPGVATPETQTVFATNAAVRAQVALLHGLYVVNLYQTQFGGSADRLSADYYSKFDQEQCGINDNHITRQALEFAFANAGKYICCLKDKQIGRAGGRKL